MNYLRSASVGLLALAVVIAAVTVLGTTRAQTASADRILVYTGNNALDHGYSEFGIAASKPVDKLSVLPSDLSPYACIVLPLNASSFSASQKSALSSYVNGGGRIVALAENYIFVDDFHPGVITTMNELATAFGSGLSITPALIDSGFHTTTNIDPSSFTVGVSSIRYAATSEVSVAASGTAESLVRTIGGTTFIGADQIGSGLFVLSGDANVFSDNSDTGYSQQDNGVLVANICGELTPTPVSAGDVNCDDVVNIIDALFILQYEVGLRAANSGCPLPPPPPDTLNVAVCDVNDDGICNVVDALFILQCEVGIPNTFCPPPLAPLSQAARSHGPATALR